jgi:hypothetical protein
VSSSIKKIQNDNKYNKPTVQTGIEIMTNGQSLISLESLRIGNFKCNLIFDSGIGNMSESVINSNDSIFNSKRKQKVNIDSFYKEFGYLKYGTFPKVLSYMAGADTVINKVANIKEKWLIFYARFEAVMEIYRLQREHKLKIETILLAVYLLDKSINFFCKKFHELLRSDVIDNSSESRHNTLIKILNKGKKKTALA